MGSSNLEAVGLGRKHVMILDNTIVNKGAKSQSSIVAINVVRIGVRSIHPDMQNSHRRRNIFSPAARA